MFKHLLIPTDGSEASQKAIRKALELASALKARVTGLHVIRSVHLVAGYDMGEEPRPAIEVELRAAAQRYLEVIEQGARQLDVPVESLVVTADDPWQEIIQVARTSGCDLIVMASHGRRGVKAVLLGSETHKVLTHSGIPVLVLR